MSKQNKDVDELLTTLSRMKDLSLRKADKFFKENESTLAICEIGRSSGVQAAIDEIKLYFDK